MTVRELKKRMTSAEVTDWYAYYRVEESDRKRAVMDAKAQASAQSRRRTK